MLCCDEDCDIYGGVAWLVAAATEVVLERF